MLSRQFRFCITKAQEKAYPRLDARIQRLPCVKGGFLLASLYLRQFTVKYNSEKVGGHFFVTANASDHSCASVVLVG